MAGLRVFVSSTCFDLSILRSQLRLFIQSLGYEPIMSDYEEILYDPREHTHTSCVDEVGNCDMLIFVIGSRYGGGVKDETLSKINFDKLSKEDSNVDALKKTGNFSISQLEFLKAVEMGIPVYTFIEKNVWHDHGLYEKNKDSKFSEQIIFPAIQKQETAKYIFEFINFVRLRSRGNNIFQFEKEIDIEQILKKQWSGYFQRLLHEQRMAKEEQNRMNMLSEKFDDLKTAILSSIENDTQRDVANAIVRYKKLFEFLFSFGKFEESYLKTTKDSWTKIFEKIGVIKIVDINEYETNNSQKVRCRTAFVCKEGFYEIRRPKRIIDSYELEWLEFIKISNNNKSIIVDTLKKMYKNIFVCTYNNNPFEEIFTKKKEEEMDLFYGAFYDIFADE